MSAELADLEIVLRPLQSFEADSIQPLIAGYVSPSVYVPLQSESPALMALELRLAPLAQPFVKRWQPMDAATRAGYAQAVATGFSWGAYAGTELVAVALAGPQVWNNTLWVWEFHVASAWQRRGIGSRLMAALAAQAAGAGFRSIVCETQNTNVPAIEFYRRQGFLFDGARLALYAGTESDGEVAIYMQRALP